MYYCDSASDHFGPPSAFNELIDWCFGIIAVETKQNTSQYITGRRHEDKKYAVLLNGVFEERALGRPSDPPLLFTR